MSPSSWQTSVVVAHGAFHKASQYDEFGTQLEDLGMNTVVPQLPSSSTTPPSDAFAADVETLHSALVIELSAGHNVILLAHSYGGIPGCAALKNMPNPCTPNLGRVLGVVFVSAFVAEEAQSLVTAKKAEPAAWVRTEGALAYVNDAENIFFNSISEPFRRASLARELTAQALSSFLAPTSYAGWEHYPSYYIRCERDHAGSIEEQNHYIERLKQSATSVGQLALEEADHCPHVSMPRELALRVGMIRKEFEGVAAQKSELDHGER